MKIEDMKKAGDKVELKKNVANPMPINLDKSQVHNLHHEAGTDGFEKKKTGGMWNPMKRSSVLGVITTASINENKNKAPDRGSRAELDDLYARQSNKFQGGFLDAAGDDYRSSNFGAQNPMIRESAEANVSDVYSNNDQDAAISSTHNPMASMDHDKL